MVYRVFIGSEDHTLICYDLRRLSHPRCPFLRLDAGKGCGGVGGGESVHGVKVTLVLIVTSSHLSARHIECAHNGVFRRLKCSRHLSQRLVTLAGQAGDLGS